MFITPWIKATVNQLSREKSGNLGLMGRKCGSRAAGTKLANSAAVKYLHRKSGYSRRFRSFAFREGQTGNEPWTRDLTQNKAQSID